jgi:hypothetical protein
MFSESSSGSYRADVIAREQVVIMYSARRRYGFPASPTDTYATIAARTVISDSTGKDSRDGTDGKDNLDRIAVTGSRNRDSRG